MTTTMCETFLGAILYKTKFNLFKWYLHPNFYTPKCLHRQYKPEKINPSIRGYLKLLVSRCFSLLSFVYSNLLKIFFENKIPLMVQMTQHHLR